jgi:hypothetical protein
MLGDVTERWALGQPGAWIWKEVLVAFAEWIRRRAQRPAQTAGFAAVGVLALGGMFWLGFQTAGSRWAVHEEMPSEEMVRALVQQRAQMQTRRDQIEGTLEFFTRELNRMETAFAKSPSADLKETIDLLKLKLRAAQLSASLAQRKVDGGRLR